MDELLCMLTSGPYALPDGAKKKDGTPETERTFSFMDIGCAPGGGAQRLLEHPLCEWGSGVR